jgi:tetratricopeptide (TPR) repeat protein
LAGYLYLQKKETSSARQEEISSGFPFIGEIDIKLEITDSATSKDNSTEILNNAIAKFNAEGYSEALELFLEISDMDKRGTAGAGLAYVKLNDYESAVTHLEKALALGEDKFIVRKFLSFAYYMKNNLEKSTLNAKAALAIQEEAELRNFFNKVVREKEKQANFMNEEALHFKVIYDGYVHGGISRGILNILEEAYNDIGGEMLHFPDVSITVILYSEKDFFDVTMRPAWVMGSYDGKIRLPVKDIQKQNESLLRKVLYHEYVHALVHTMTPEVPLWINEGLAEYLVPRGLDRIGQVIPLTDLEKDFPMNDRKKVATAYRESFSAVSYLVEKNSIYAVKELLLSLGQGKVLNQAFESAFFISYDEFVSKWK